MPRNISRQDLHGEADSYARPAITFVPFLGGGPYGVAVFLAPGLRLRDTLPRTPT